jgi:hypothetical protein
LVVRLRGARVYDGAGVRVRERLEQFRLAVSLEASPPLPESRAGDAAATADEAGVLSAGVGSNLGEARLNPMLNVAHASA